MLVLSGVCGMMAFFVLIASSMSRSRKVSLFLIELSGMLLLVFDRWAYIYRGNPSVTGYWMVRISNFMVFFLTLETVGGFNFYLKDLLLHEGGLKKPPQRLKACNSLVLTGIALVVLSQFTGLYYTFDEYNTYQRSSGFILCYIFPVLILVIQISVIIQYGRFLSRWIFTSLVLFSTMPLIASVIQIIWYGGSFTNISIVIMCIVVYVFAYIDMNQAVEKAHRQEVEYLEEQRKSMSRMFEQAAHSIASAVDEYKTHSKGHSERVANYSRQIAKICGKSEEECQNVYLAALLHDVGLIGVPDSVMSREGERTEGEQDMFQEHSTIGDEILSGIEEFPYLREGAHFHHERFDGKGYPMGLKGKAIPELARIITVADAYDTMTSKKEYRDPLPQIRVREELVKEEGLRFDPEFSKAMLYLMDQDPDYRMKELTDDSEKVLKSELNCEGYRHEISVGIPVTKKEIYIGLNSTPKTRGTERFSIPSLILFDSLDGCVHNTEQTIIENSYSEFGEIWFDGHTICTKARNIKVDVTGTDPRSGEDVPGDKPVSCDYEVVAGRYKDHMRIVITGGGIRTEAIVALPDNTRYTYIGITGENCDIADIRTYETGEKIKEGDIPRISEEITYTNRLESDLKNVQIDGDRTAATEGIPVHDGMRIAFHTMSLPSAQLVWHCPYVLLYWSKDKQFHGEEYREYVVVRLDGEIIETNADADNKMTVSKTGEFEGWDVWKQLNRKGMECIVNFGKKGDRVTITTENAGIVIKNTTIIPDKDIGEVYAALTGDLVALTDIRII